MRIFGKLLLWIIGLFVASTLAVVVIYKYVPVYITPLMVIRACENNDFSWEHKWVPLEEISENMALAVISSEDNRYMQHNGFDFIEIQKAREEAKRGKKQRGASTISQQTAKNVFLWPERSWVRKGLEAYFTLLIEWIWGKERIMEVYLNSIEMGKAIYGVEAVAENNFRKQASKLTRSEASLIAATLPNPIKFSSKYPSSYMKKRQRQIRSLMSKVENPHLGC